MTSSRGTGITINGTATDGYAVTVTPTDKPRVEKVLADHGIAFTTRDGGHLSGEADDVEFVFDSAIDAESIQELLDDAE